MYFGSTSWRDGAYRPSGSAPPAPTELWQAVQLVRKNSPPRPICSSLAFSQSKYLSSGISGPGPSDATYADSWLISSSVYTGSFSGACGPDKAIGIRPVPTWKSTAAAPTPTSDGP